MGRETKLGVVFVGILLTVFCAMLIKRLTRTTSVPAANLTAATSGKATDMAPATRQPLTTTPTLVTPLEGSKPPELATSRDRNTWTNPSVSSVSGGPSSQRDRYNSTNDTARATTNPPSLLATPTPIVDGGNRYANSPAAQATDHLSRDAAPVTNESTTIQSSPLTYQSGYAGNGDISDSSSSDRNGLESHNSTESLVKTAPPDRQPYETLPAAGAENLPSFRQTPIAGRNDSNAAAPGAMPPKSAAASDPIYTGGSRIGATASVRTTGQNAPVQIANPRTEFSQSASSAGNISAAPIASNLLQRNGDQYAVQPNDSYWMISEKAYGTGGFFKALYEYNRKRSKDADELKLGQVLLVPEEGVLRRSYPDLCPKPRKTLVNVQQRLTSASNRIRGTGRIYTVVEGDTLFEIARHELGRPARWAEIYDLNRDILGDDSDYLRPGTELILPTAAGSGDPSRGNTAVRQQDAVHSR